MGPLTGLAMAVLIMAPLIVAPGPSLASQRPAEGPAALILDYSGPLRNGLDAYGEIAPGARISLGPRDRLVILHYQSCREVAVTGGNIAVSAGDLVVSDALDRRDGRSHCPQEVNTAQAGGEAQVIAPRLDCVVVGRHKAEVGEAEIIDAAAMVLSAPAQGYRLISAPAAPELRDGKTYTLVLRGIRGAELARVPVVARAAAQDKACLLRLD